MNMAKIKHRVQSAHQLYSYKFYQIKQQKYSIRF